MLYLLNAAAVLAALAPLTSAIPRSSHVLHEKRDLPPRNWVKRSRLVEHSDHVNLTLPMRIGMTQRNLDKGHDLLMEVSRHDSDKFGQYYTADEIIDLFAPADESERLVREWLEMSGIEPNRISQSANKQWMQFDASPAEAEELLKTEYYMYEHVPTGGQHLGCDEYHVPAHVQKHVDYITPGLRLRVRSADRTASLKKRGFKSGQDTTFSSPRIIGPISKTLAVAATTCDQQIVPSCIATMYNITKATRSASGNQLGIFEEGDYYSASDLSQFFQTYAPSIPSSTKPILEGIDGGTAPLNTAGEESNLDFMVSYPIIYPQNSVLFQTDDYPYATGQQPSGGFLNTFLDALDGSYCTYSAFGQTGDSSIDPVYPDPYPGGYTGQRQCGVYKPTNVISISYGAQEDDLPTNYQQRQCNEFMKLGMQGVSIILASGDSGVAARGPDAGNSNGCLGSGEVFNPDFPATCPYVTAVGATYLPTGASATGDNERAVSRFPSGGGFSNIYTRPSYQNTAVNNYFTNHNPPYPYYSTSGTNNPSASTTNGGLYNRAGRGYPDVSAVGDNIAIIFNGSPVLIGGTSAAAPIFAAILNRINEERLALGKSTVGFVNPTLYSNPTILHDMTVGSNPGCGTQGFSVASGWDPVTGLGTPNYTAMLKLYKSLK